MEGVVKPQLRLAKGENAGTPTPIRTENKWF
nr:MAG TPA: hypothetical protein [Caudoviricetes sp.]